MNPDLDPLNFPFPEQLPTGDAADQADTDDEPTAEDLVDAAVDHEAQQRLWLRAIVQLLQLRSHETDLSDRVQFAFDLMHIAAAERIARLMHGDLPTE